MAPDPRPRRTGGHVVGIDLGTTHCVVAFARAGSQDQAAIFPIPQLVDRAALEARELLPSCLYAPLPGETVADDAARFAPAPWVSGELARRRGAEVPGRLVASAKSWLCHAGVDRLAAILPWGKHEDDDPVPLISPVDASAAYLGHVRRAWDDAHPDAPLAEQDVVLTVPASFDEGARALTLEATRRAGLTVRLLEEPQAAFYDFLAQAGESGLASLLGARTEADVLVCDVGGGTTDLSLLRATRASGRVEIARVAVGDHLLLGGDNMDLALAHACEPRLGAGRLAPARFGQLVAACRSAKETLLGEGAPDEATVTLLGEGSRLVGGTKRATLTRDEALELVLEGFFPRVDRDAVPARARGALVSFGLPYARDTAITRHLARFLAVNDAKAPAFVLLNGGVFHAARIGARVCDVIGSWGEGPPAVLPHTAPDLAVARGAVAYGLALAGHGRTIGGGSARGYYVVAAAADASHAVCVVPKGAEAGARFRADVGLKVLVGRPVRFDLVASTGADHRRAGDVVQVTEDDFHRLPPVTATLPGDGTVAELPVALEGELTEIGTLDLACVEQGPRARRFHLAFELRGPTSSPTTLPPPPRSTRPPRRLDEATALLAATFGKAKDDVGPAKDLVRELTRVLGDRTTWSAELARELFDALVPLARGRRRSADHERMFWSLAGYALRPGFGAPGDDARIARLFPLFGEGVTHSRDQKVHAQWMIAWRRVAGGLDEAMQGAIRESLEPLLSPASKRGKTAALEAEGELLDLVGFLERAPVASKVQLGEQLVERTWTRTDARLWETIGRLGAREPAYASAHLVVPVRVAEAWIDELLRAKWTDLASAPAAAHRLARMTGDRARDVGDRARREIAKRLDAVGRTDLAHAVRELVVAETRDGSELLGESLPSGLRL